MKKNWFIGLGLIIFIVGACSKDSGTEEPLSQNYTIVHDGLPAPNIPSDNIPTTQGVALGRRLFYEKLLSKDNSMSCASCHEQKNAFSDTDRFSIGVEGKPGKRQAMAIFNMLWNQNEFFWDGRAHLLRDQALMPIEDPLEMNISHEEVVEKLNAQPDYQNRFKAVFGSPEINPKRISLALEQFMNILISNSSKYDKVLADKADFSPQEARGRDLFFSGFNALNPAQSGAGCSNCHGGPNFENNAYMNNGLDLEADIVDVGRMKVSGQAFEKGTFKVPSLRNIAVTPPYMHDGRFNTLEEVIDHYDHGIRYSSSVNSTLESIQQAGGLALTPADKQALIAFLNTLTDHEFLNNPKFSDPF
ncbi:cytochrome-c peroxidase [Sediminicola luteus]|uniref:Cytochrome-c peroxidase n=1 Tax=Sediminicola luteus TaxID=319238 RepID=A0A2A4GER1_9FLAO|nr:cytochrome c peroxidase [Sediminicola luteus]PCE66232.1 cytochrome-c peroxidase [Sediminicola luteus]